MAVTFARVLRGASLARADRQRVDVRRGARPGRDRRPRRRVLGGAVHARAPARGSAAVRPGLRRLLGARHGRTAVDDEPETIKITLATDDDSDGRRRRREPARRTTTRRSRCGSPRPRCCATRTSAHTTTTSWHDRAAADDAACGSPARRDARSGCARRPRGPRPDLRKHAAQRDRRRRRADPPVLAGARRAPAPAGAAARRQRLDGALRPGDAAIRAGRGRRPPAGRGVLARHPADRVSPRS